MKKLPMGISTFSKIIENDYIYVDKTRTIYKMANRVETYFLSRPRRFGKSLLVNTLKELFQGNKELFEGLYIHDKWDWTEKHPVIHLDFGSRTTTSPEQLELSLNKFLNNTAEDNNIQLEDTNLLNDKFEELIKKLYKKTGKKVVVLIDEYDNPIIDCIKNIEIAKENRDILSDFYKVLKATDEYLRFIFLTGVTKFSKTSIFSGLNNVTDITLNNNFSDICGYTQDELENCFKGHIDKFSKDSNTNREKLLSLIEEWYDGYSWDGSTYLYNPYSILSLFNSGEFSNYWFETGTPSFLMDFVKNNNGTDVLFKPNTTISGNFPSFNLKNLDFTTLLLQTGYLTIKEKRVKVGKLTNYELGIPNKEVSESLFTSIINEFSNQESTEVNNLAEKILEAIINIDNDSLQEAFDVLVANIPAMLYGKIKEDIREVNYHIWFLSWFRLMGFFVIGKNQSSKGYADMVLKKDNLIVVCEFKYGLDKSLENLAIEAINQIKDKKYHEQYLDYNVALLGVAFGDREVKSIIEDLKL